MLPYLSDIEKFSGKKRFVAKELSICMTDIENFSGKNISLCLKKNTDWKIIKEMNAFNNLIITVLAHRHIHFMRPGMCILCFKNNPHLTNLLYQEQVSE